jgi:hypothetical protein
MSDSTDHYPSETEWERVRYRFENQVEEKRVSFNREQLEAWAFRSLTDREVETTEETALSNSIPEVIGVIADQLHIEEET